MLRTLAFFWRINVAVGLGAAVATAVLTGALLVGDSVRGSLADLTLERLGRIELALVSHRFFRESLADDLAARGSAGGVPAPVAPAVLLDAGALRPDTGARASRVRLVGLDDRLAEMIGWPAGQGLPERGAVVNESLGRELGVTVGEDVLLSFRRAGDVPLDTLMGDRDPADVVDRLRVRVDGVIPDRGAGRFGLSPRQGTPLNVFVSLGRIQRALDRPDRVNALFVGVERAEGVPAAALRASLVLEDLGLAARTNDGVLSLESEEFVLRPHIVRTAESVAAGLGLPVRRVQTYLANRMELGGRGVPYSTITAVDPAPTPPFEPLLLIDGSAAPALADDEILLNEWAANDLGAGPGDDVVVTYYAIGPREELLARTTRFRLRGIVSMEGLGADRHLTPDYPGLQDAEDISAWDPPFPVDLDAIRPRDEEYWDRFRGTPKAFVAEATGRRLWSTRHGHVTAVRVGVGDGRAADGFRRALLAALDPEPFGFRLDDVRTEGLEASKGATDFSGLFLAFSMFLIASAALLTGLLFSLGVERRATETGLLLSVGYPVRRVRRRLTAEGALVAAAGALVGALGGIAYAGLLMAGLRTLWLPAVGTSALFLHVNPLSVALGGAISLAVVTIAIRWTIRRLRRVPTPALLAGSTRPVASRRSRRATPVVAFGGLAAALGLAATASLTGSTASAGLAFGTGACLLASGLAFFALWCRGAGRGGLLGGERAVLLGMAARGSSWSPGRSILCVALVGCACFVIVTVAANRQGHAVDVRDPESGAGGFSLLAEASVPLHHDLNSPEARSELGLAEEDLEGVRVFPFRVLPGSDASCLNLYRPEKPTVLGVPPELVARGGFGFQQTIEDASSGWELLERDLGPGVIPAIGDFNSVLWILHKGLGQDLVLEDEFGEEIRLRLVALLRKGVFQSEILISEGNFLEHFPSRSGYAYFLVETPPGRERQTAEALEEGLSRFGLDTTETERKLADYQAVENTYMSTFETLGGLGLLLGTVGLAVVLVRNVIERRGELATLRAFGFRRRRLAAMVVLENLFLLATGAVVGSASAVLAVAPRILSGEIELPWLYLAATLAVVLAAGIFSSVAAVASALGVPLLPALKTEV